MLPSCLGGILHWDNLKYHRLNTKLPIGMIIWGWLPGCRFCDIPTIPRTLQAWGNPFGYMPPYLPNFFFTAFTDLALGAAGLGSAFNPKMAGILSISGFLRCFQSETSLVFMMAPLDVKPAATEKRVSLRRHFSADLNTSTLRWGASMNSSVEPSSCDLISSLISSFSLTIAFVGRYPLNANFCPPSPDAINARMGELGPVSGITSIS